LATRFIEARSGILDIAFPTSAAESSIGIPAASLLNKSLVFSDVDFRLIEISELYISVDNVPLDVEQETFGAFHVKELRRLEQDLQRFLRITCGGILNCQTLAEAAEFEHVDRALR
jgi:hypothetical protein